MEHVAETRGLVKEFGSVRAVDNLDLSIRRGEIFGFIGPNGSGKTTTIKILIGLLKATSGEAYVLGRRVPNPSIYQKIGYMPQEIALYPDITVKQTFQFFGEIYALSREEIVKREKELLAFVDLEGKREEMIHNLSGGMKHRLSLAVSLIHNPEFLFLDEPTVGVDPELRVSLWEHFNHLTSQGITVLITTHYMDEANRCDRVGMIMKGKLVSIGPPEDLKRETGCESLEDAFLWYLRRAGR